jgi:hypothetical protein
LSGHPVCFTVPMAAPAAAAVHHLTKMPEIRRVSVSSANPLAASNCT